MSTTLTVPSIKCDGCAAAITKEIKAQDANAAVTIDVDQKTVAVESELSVDALTQVITAAGHKVA